MAMEMTYLCRARQADVLDLKKGQLQENGILIQQSKTDVAQIKAWTPRFHEAIQIANTLSLNRGVNSIYLLHHQPGARFTRDSFNSHWTKAKKAASLKYPELDFNFTFHDLKAKGISDLSGSLYDKQSISGHKNISQTARYDRKVKVVPVVGGQNKVK